MTNSDNPNIFSTFAATAERHPDKTAVYYLGTRFTYCKLKNLSERFAAALSDNGVEPGQRVMLYIPNSIQWVVSWLGVQKIGAVAVPITPIYTPHDISYIANDSEAEAIICADTNFGYVTSVLPETGLKMVIVSKMADLLTGGSLILQPRINLDAALDAIQRCKATTMIGVPTLYRMILEHVRLDQYNLNSLKYCFSGGDVLPTEVSKRWKEKFGLPIYQGYGATETCGGVSMCPATVDNPPKSVGQIVASKKAIGYPPRRSKPPSRSIRP
jgi:acyl-CoA synthetase (AMP-forming)/AMP-acid ligase II